MLAAMHQLHAAMERLEAHCASQFGLPRNDARCLALLGEGPMSPRAIGARLGLTSGSVTALLDRLERQAYVARRRDPDDRRGVLVERTPIAAARLASLDAPLIEALSGLAARYGSERSDAAAQQVADLARLAEWAAARVAQAGGTG